MADCGSFFAASAAWSAEAAYMAFSYLSQASSRDLRASSDLVERGIAPKSCCGTGATGGVWLAARSEAGATRGAGDCAQAPTEKSAGKISKKKRAAKRAM